MHSGIFTYVLRDPDEYTVNILEIYTKNIKYTLHCSRECSIFTVYFYMHSGIFTYVLRDPDEYTVNILEIYTKNIKYTLHCSSQL